MTKTGDAARPPMELDADSLLETLIARKREISIAVIVIAVAAGSWILWRQSVQKKEDRAEQALGNASASYYAGNAQLAQKDLQAMVKRYGDTSAGVEGTMLLAQINYEGGKYDDGVKALAGVEGSSASKRFAAAIEELIADGYLGQKKYDEAIKHFLAAADRARFPTDQDMYRAEAARTMGLAGKKGDAIKIWAELATKLDSPAFSEAKIRLGELEAAPASRN